MHVYPSVPYKYFHLTSMKTTNSVSRKVYKNTKITLTG